MCCEEILLSMEFVKPTVLVSFWAPVAWSDMHYGFTSENSVHNHQSSFVFSSPSEWEIDVLRVLPPTLFMFLRQSSTHNIQICNKWMFVKQIFVRNCTYVQQVARLNVLQQNQKYPACSVSAVASTIISQPPSKFRHVQTCNSTRCNGCLTMRETFPQAVSRISGQAKM